MAHIISKAACKWEIFYESLYLILDHEFNFDIRLLALLNMLIFLARALNLL